MDVGSRVSGRAPGGGWGHAANERDTGQPGWLLWQALDRGPLPRGSPRWNACRLGVGAAEAAAVVHQAHATQCNQVLSSPPTTD